MKTKYAITKVAKLLLRSTTRMYFRNSVEPYTGSMIRASNNRDTTATNTCTAE